MQIILILVLLAVLVANFFLLLRTGLLIVTVKGQSMYPTLQHGNRILVARRWLAGRPRKGQIVVLTIDTELEEHDTSSNLHKTCYVKRVVATAGESFSAPLYVNAHARTERDIAVRMASQVGSWQIPRDHVFVCGDNEEESIDSRSWGPLSLSDVLGSMVMKLPPAIGDSASSNSLLR